MSEEILPFTTEHLDTCAYLLVEVFNGEPWNEHWNFETARMLLLETLNTPGFIGLVLQENHQVLGFLIGYCEQSYDSKRFYLKEICVQPNRKRQGIGTKLLHQLSNTLSGMNVKLVYLLTMKEGEAEAFYTKNGYQRSQRVIMMIQRL